MLFLSNIYHSFWGRSCTRCFPMGSGAGCSSSWAGAGEGAGLHQGVSCRGMWWGGKRLWSNRRGKVTVGKPGEGSGWQNWRDVSWVSKLGLSLVKMEPLVIFLWPSLPWILLVLYTRTAGCFWDITNKGWQKNKIQKKKLFYSKNFCFELYFLQQQWFCLYCSWKDFSSPSQDFVQVLVSFVPVTIWPKKPGLSKKLNEVWTL